MNQKPLHSALYKPDDRFIHRKLKEHGPNPKKVLREVGEQIYAFKMFTPEFCKLLLEEAEARGNWHTGRDEGYEGRNSDEKTRGVAEKNILASQKDGKEVDTKQYFAAISYDGIGRPSNGNDLDDAREPKGGSLCRAYVAYMQKYILPMIQQLWPSFQLGRMDPPYILKYEPSVVKQMSLHYDYETIAMITYLNTDFKGGGTYFPRWKKTLKNVDPGDAVFYPGGLAHEHLGLPITAGKRYLMCGSFFDHKVK